MEQIVLLFLIVWTLFILLVLLLVKSLSTSVIRTYFREKHAHLRAMMLNSEGDHKDDNIKEN